MWQRIAYIFACVAIPVLWGVLVNAVFRWWERRRAADLKQDAADSNNGDDTFFPDYQI